MASSFYKPLKPALVAFALTTMLLLIGAGFSACERKPEPQPQPVASPVTPPPQPTPTEPAEPATGEITPSEPAEPEIPARIFRIYENENEPEVFVELVEFNTGCEGLGNIFAEEELVVDPTLDSERKIPLARVVSLTFNNYGLIDIKIPDVGKVHQPAAYRENTVTLKDPDETVEGILVICRDLSGKKADGTDWLIELKGDPAKKFYKIELVEAPE